MGRYVGDDLFVGGDADGDRRINGEEYPAAEPSRVEFVDGTVGVEHEFAGCFGIEIDRKG